MISKVTKVGSSIGVIIPRYIASECNFAKGSPINIEYVDNKIIISKPELSRSGWAAAFKEYAAEGEDSMMLPDVLDSEAMELI